MSGSARVMKADDPARRVLEREGWVVTECSWGAHLDVTSCDRDRLRDLAARAASLGVVRALGSGDAAAVLALDAATAQDYPGGKATAHRPLTPARALVNAARRAHGVFCRGVLAAVTFVDINGHRGEIDFTVVAREHRGQGLATGVKAASVLDLLGTGVELVRTGGSARNDAILAANAALGFVVDEEWVTLLRPTERLAPHSSV